MPKMKHEPDLQRCIYLTRIYLFFQPTMFLFPKKDKEWNRKDNSNSDRYRGYAGIDDVSREGYYGPSNHDDNGPYHGTSNSVSDWKCLEVKKQRILFYTCNMITNEK